ncbi:MAG: hypothetical protein ACK4JB_09510 [Reyranella sp.]
MTKAPSFSRETLVETLTELAGLVGVHETTVDLALYGPACLLMATTLYTTVTTIDAVAVEGQSQVDEAVVQLAGKHGWPSNWMTDRIRKHLNRRVEPPSHHLLMLRVPAAPLQRLRVFVPEWDYLLTLKVSALTLSEPIDRQKQRELRYLMRVSGVRAAGDLDDLLTRYNSNPCEKRRMTALAHAVWWQCAAAS